MATSAATEPTVSVVITAHNYGRYVEWAIRSALMQSAPPRQVIVVDDASTDDTPAVVAAFGSAVEYQRVEFRNAQLTRNAGLALATMDLVLFLDADDYLAQDALDQVLQPFRTQPGCKLAYGDLVPFGDSDEIRSRGRGRYWRAQPFSLDRIRFENYIQTSALLRRAGFPGFDPRINRAQEWDAWLGFLSSDDEAVHVPVPVLHYRVHGRSLTLKTSELVERLKVLLKHRILPLRSLAAASVVPPAERARRRRVLVYCHGSAAVDVSATLAAAKQAGLCGSLVFLGIGEPTSHAATFGRARGGRLHMRFVESGNLERVLRQDIALLGDPYLELIAWISDPVQLVTIAGGRAPSDELVVFGSQGLETLLEARELQQLSPMVMTRSTMRYLQYLPPPVDTSAAGKLRWSFGRWLRKNVTWRWREPMKAVTGA